MEKINGATIRYEWLKFDAYTSFDNLKANIKDLLDGFGTKCIIKIL